MLPLKLVFIWHQHQPYYKSGNEFLLPWVRLHAQKDYFDIPNVLHEFPSIKQTFNLVPSLALQLSQYAEGAAMDKAQRLTLKPANELTVDDKKYILKSFFMLHIDNLLKPHERYRELWERASDKEHALQNFSEQDWRDLQTWYTLAWFGYYSSKKEVIKRLIDKGRNFSENEKRIAAVAAMKVVSKVMEEYKTLRDLEQIEVSCSPFYHPILPLLIDSASALDAMPQLGGSVRGLFSAPEDAETQVQKARELYRKYFDSEPTGIWPSEGSISNQTLDLLIRNGFEWVAGDEGVLEKSISNGFKSTEKFFPRKYKNHNGEITVFFRDRFLSDRIGFVYSSWNESDAANDFLNNLSKIRQEIIKIHGEQALNHAAISIILDGENCWEYYHDNGIPFLKELFGKLQSAKEFKTVTASEAASSNNGNYLPYIENIRAGSWINSDFKIWIGDEDDRHAWKMLADTRRLIHENRHKLDAEKYRLAMEEIYIAEGSDWFWWYGPEHISENNPDFDYLFRSHLLKIYELLGEKPPDEINNPVGNTINYEIFALPKSILDSGLEPNFDRNKLWQNAGFYDATKAMSAMHQSGEILKKVYFGNDRNFIYFGFDLIPEQNTGSITIDIQQKSAFSFEISHDGIEQKSGDSIEFVFMNGDEPILAMDKSVFKSDLTVKFHVETNINDLQIHYPKQDFLEFGLY